jgi:hypothetical protein
MPLLLALLLPLLRFNLPTLALLIFRFGPFCRTADSYANSNQRQRPIR